jgi:hypothetical protein
VTVLADDNDRALMNPITGIDLLDFATFMLWRKRPLNRI